jgi:GNAT superfamily N-acetyltransferase
MEGLTIRLAAIEEADTIASLWLRSRAVSIDTIPPAAHSDYEVRRWFTEIVVPDRDVWVAQIAGEDIIGLLVLDAEWLDQLYVDPDEWGNGIGSALLDKAKQERPVGFDLWTFTENVGARRFYERHGLAVIDWTDDDNEEAAPAIRYRWAGLNDLWLKS